MLHPIFEEASNVIKEEYPNENQVVFARVDCDQHSDIAQRYRISKYPTLKLFRNGMMMKREYRGQRSVKALADYIRQQKSDPVQELHDLVEITTLDDCFQTRKIQWRQHNLQTTRAFCSRYGIFGIYDQF